LRKNEKVRRIKQAVFLGVGIEERTGETA